MNRKLLAGACALAVLTLAGCGSIPQGADRINIITEQEAKANNCRLLDKAGSVSAVMVNGYKRNTQVAVTKALRVPGTTNVRMFVWKCPNPNLRTKDAQVAAWQKEYLGH